MGVKVPSPPSVGPPPPTAHPPTLGDTGLLALLEKQNTLKANGKGMDNTIKTSAQGLPPPNTGKATLLG